MSTYIGKRYGRVGVFIGSLVLLISTWYLMFTFITWTTHTMLVYWTSAPDQSPLRAWERPVRDSFAVPPGSVLPSTVVIVVSTGLFAIGIARTTNKIRLPSMFAVTNLAFLCAAFFLGRLAWDINAALLPRPRPLIDVGYHYTWPVILVTIILLIILFIVQSKLALGTQRHLVEGCA